MTDDIVTRLGYETNVLLECIKYGIERGTVGKIDLDMVGGQMTLTFAITQELVSKFVQSVDRCRKGL